MLPGHLRPTRRHVIGAATALGGLALPTLGASDEIDNALADLLFGDMDDFDGAVHTLSQAPSPDLAASLIFALRFSRGPRGPIVGLLERATGHSGPYDWFGWMLWQEAHPEIVPRPSFTALKRRVFLAIDPTFADFLHPDHLERDRMRIRFEEITWGGVKKDGIPSLDRPKMITPEAAAYLLDTDLVFGVAINGDVRAYPLRIMGWHEMFNDVIGGVPVALAYCTLCGAGILFETHVDARAEPFIFGSSGFLYRSNKLMFDRETHSLWNQFTGKPVVGPLIGSAITLRQRPVVIARWDAWKRANPGTTVLSDATGHHRDYRSGVVYSDYFASPDLMFPACDGARDLAQKDYVFGVRTFGGAKAWPLDAFAETPVINDRIGETEVVLVGEPKGRTVRAYASGGRVFRQRDKGLAADGQIWRITEDALIGADGSRAPRIAGHIAYWFAWDGYLGQRSELYRR